MTPQTAPIPRRDLAPIAARARRTQRLRERATGPVRMSLWLPTTAIFGLLAPFALMAIPFLYAVPRAYLASPARAVLGLGAVLLSLGGTHVEVDAADTRVRIHFF